MGKRIVIAMILATACAVLMYAAHTMNLLGLVQRIHGQ